MTQTERPILPERQWSKQVIQEYREHRNPNLTADIDIIWVISGWTVYDPDLSPSFVNVAQNTIFESEDTEMINMGIDLAYEITALRLSKPKTAVTKEEAKVHGPILLYNGNIDQNDNLRLASQKSDFRLPSEKLRIEKLADDREPKNNNTNKQFEKFPDEFLQGTRKMAIVSHLWHLSRIARNPLAPSLIAQEPLWQDIEVVYFAADTPGNQLPHDQKSVHKRAIDIRRHVMDEGRKIYIYSQKGDLTQNPFLENINV